MTLGEPPAEGAGERTVAAGVCSTLGATEALGAPIDAGEGVVTAGAPQPAVASTMSNPAAAPATTCRVIGPPPIVRRRPRGTRGLRPERTLVACPGRPVRPRRLCLQANHVAAAGRSRHAPWQHPLAAAVPCEPASQRS